MSEATYTAWDDNSYPWPPPDGWYQAGDGKWWPDGYGPQGTDGSEGSAVSDTSSGTFTSESSSSVSAGPAAVDVGDSSGSAVSGSAGYSSAAATSGSSARTSSSEIFERMQREASHGTSGPWSSSEAVTQAPGLTGDAKGSVLERAADSSASAVDSTGDSVRSALSEATGSTGSAVSQADGAVGSVMDRATDGLGSDASGVVDSVESVSESVSESAEGFVDRRGAGLAAGAAAVGAAAFASSGASEVDEADYQSASNLETDGVASGEFAGGYGATQSEAVAAPSYEAPDAHAPVADYSAGQVDGLTTPADFDSSPVADRVSSEFSSPEYRAPDSLEHDAAGSDYAGADFAASGFAPPEAPAADATTALDQPIPGQQLPSEYSSDYNSDYNEEFSSSYQGAYTEPGFEADSGTGVSDASTAVPAALGGPQAPTYDTPGVNGDASVGGNDLSVNEYQVAGEATPGVDGDPWDDPSVDTAVNPVVRAESPQGPAPGPLDGPSSLPDPGPDPFGTGSSGGPAFDDGRFASSYDNGGQLDRQQSRGPLLAPPVHEQSKGGRGRGLLLSLVVLAALALAGLAGFFFYQQQQGGDGETAEVAEAGADAAPGSLTNPHDSSRAVQIEYVAEDIAQVWTIQATSSAQTDLGSSTEIQADLTVANGNDDGAAALADLVVSIVDANGEVLASGANDCTNTQAMSWGQSVAGGTSVSGPICWVVPSDSVDGALLGIESTKAQGRIHIQLP